MTKYIVELTLEQAEALKAFGIELEEDFNLALPPINTPNEVKTLSDEFAECVTIDIGMKDAEFANKYQHNAVRYLFERSTSLSTTIVPSGNLQRIYGNGEGYWYPLLVFVPNSVVKKYAKALSTMR